MSNEIEKILEDISQFDIQSAIEYLLTIATNSEQEKILRAIQQRFFPEDTEVVVVNLNEDAENVLLSLSHEKNLTINQCLILCLENYIKEQNHVQDSEEEN